MKRISLGIFLTVALLAFSVAGFAEKKPYEGVTVTWLTGAGHNQIACAINKEHIKEVLGITIDQIIEPDHLHYELAMKDWVTGGGSYDMLTLHPRWNGELMEGYLLPLNKYIDKFNAWDDYNDIMETYRELYCERGGKVYGFVQDGDVATMYYRKDILGNPEYQKKFKEKYGYDMPVPPQTWDHLIDVAGFFTGWDWDKDGENEFGLNFHPWRREDMEASFLPIWGSVSGGKVLFDENMRPLINSDDGLKTLALQKKLLDYMPPGFISFTWSETFASFIEGTVAISLSYPDIGRLILNEGTFGGAGGPQNKGKIGYAAWPATFLGGEPFRYNSMCHGRIIGISSFAKNPEAAFAALLEVCKKERSILHVSNVDSGSDPFAYSHMDLANWTINVEEEFLKAHVKNMGYGYPEPLIPGLAEYYEILRIEVHGFLAGEKNAKTALANVERGWNDITERLGLDKQKKAWRGTLEILRGLGFKV